MGAGQGGDRSGPGHPVPPAPTPQRGRHCRTPGCGRFFQELNHRHCCSTCPYGFHSRRCNAQQRRLQRTAVTRCEQPGCGRHAGLAHSTCCSTCRPSQGSSHTFSCTVRQQEYSRATAAPAYNEGPAGATSSGWNTHAAVATGETASGGNASGERTYTATTVSGNTCTVVEIVSSSSEGEASSRDGNPAAAEGGRQVNGRFSGDLSEMD